MKVKVIGELKSQPKFDLWDWVVQQKLERPVNNFLAPRCLERWYGFGFNQHSVKQNLAQIFIAAHPSDRLRPLGDELYPGWHSLLTLKMTI